MSISRGRSSGVSDAYQSLHGAVERMPVVPPELGVGTLERGVPLGLRLLNAVVISMSALDATAFRG